MYSSLKTHLQPHSQCPSGMSRVKPPTNLFEGGGQAVFCWLQVLQILLAGFQAPSSPKSNPYPMSVSALLPEHFAVVPAEFRDTEVEVLSPEVGLNGDANVKNTIRFCLVLPFTFTVLYSCLQLRIGVSFFLHAGNAVKY